MVEGGGGGKLRDPQKVLVLQIAAGVQAAAGQECILDTGSQDIPKADLQVEVVQLLQQAVRRIIAQVLQMVPIGLAHSPFGLLHECPAEVSRLRGAVQPVQGLGDGGAVFLPQFPQVGRPRSLHRAGILHIKDIFQARPAAVLADQGNALGERLYPPPHGPVPQLHTGTGGGVRALGVNEELVIEGVFLKMLSRGNVRLSFYLLLFYSFKGNRRHSYREAAVIVGLMAAMIKPPEIPQMRSYC